MSTWTLEIPAIYRWINANERRHWRHKAEMTRLWRQLATVRAKAAKLPRLDKAAITAELRFRSTHRRDAHNYYPTLKAIIDGLVDYGLLPDDSTQHLIGPDVRIGEPLPRAVYGDHGLVVLTIEVAA